MIMLPTLALPIAPLGLVLNRDGEDSAEEIGTKDADRIENSTGSDSIDRSAGYDVMNVSAGDDPVFERESEDAQVGEDCEDATISLGEIMVVRATGRAGALAASDVTLIAKSTTKQLFEPNAAAA